MGLGPYDRVNERAEPERHRDRAADVQPRRAPAAVGSARLGQPDQPGDDPGHADRDIDEQDPSPGQRRGQHAAEDRPGGPARSGDRAPDPERPGPALRRERGHDDRQGGRRQQRPADALDRPRGREPGRVLRHASGQAGDREEPETEQEHPAAAEQVGGPAAEEQEPCERQHIGVDHPLQAGRRVVQVAADGRQRHVHDRDIEHDHELRHAGERQDDAVGDMPGVAGCTGRGAAGVDLGTVPALSHRRLRG
jgi:hypothetical protein